MKLVLCFYLNGIHKKYVYYKNLLHLFILKFLLYGSGNVCTCPVMLIKKETARTHKYSMTVELSCKHLYSFSIGLVLRTCLYSSSFSQMLSNIEISY